MCGKNIYYIVVARCSLLCCPLASATSVSLSSQCVCTVFHYSTTESNKLPLLPNNIHSCTNGYVVSSLLCAILYARTHTQPVTH